MLCARVMRGISSMAKDVSPARAKACISFGFESAPSSAIRMVPCFIKDTSAGRGDWTLKTMSAPLIA